MDKVVGTIYSTNDYNKFKRLDNNRSLKEKRVSKLVASFSEKEIMNPIVVNKNMEIIDGQGRYEAKKRLDLPIYYIVSPDADINDCRRMNKYNESWKLINFIESYASAGNNNYVLLLETCKTTGYPPSRVARLSNHTTRDNKNTNNNAVEDGTFKFTQSDVDTVMRVKKLADEIAEALLCTERKNDAFYTGVKVMVETDGYDHCQMLKNCKKERATYSQMSGLHNQLVEFSRIYNRGLKKAEKKLYFEDYMRNRGYNVRNYEDSYFAVDDGDVSTLRKEEKTDE